MRMPIKVNREPTLIDHILNESLFIDFHTEIMYGSDQVYNSHPCRFATVSFGLIDTYLLVQLADRIRKNFGFAPLEPTDECGECTDEICDSESWYDFYISINDYNDSKVDSCLTFIVMNSSSPDNESVYTIDLSEEEQKAIYHSLDEQCREYLGKSCEDLLAEAREYMEGA